MDRVVVVVFDDYLHGFQGGTDGGLLDPRDLLLPEFLVVGVQLLLGGFVPILVDLLQPHLSPFNRGFLLGRRQRKRVVRRRTITTTLIVVMITTTKGRHFFQLIITSIIIIIIHIIEPIVGFFFSDLS